MSKSIQTPGPMLSFRFRLAPWLAGLLCFGLLGWSESSRADEDIRAVAVAVQELEGIFISSDFLHQALLHCHEQPCSDQQIEGLWNQALKHSQTMDGQKHIFSGRLLQADEMARQFSDYAQATQGMDAQEVKAYAEAHRVYAASISQLEKDVIGERGPQLRAMTAKLEQDNDLKTNMHTFQTLIETYAVDWGGVYAADVKSLRAEATQASYWKELSNPYTGKIGEGKGGAYLDYQTFKNYAPQKALAGLVIYAPLGDKPVITYFVYGCDAEGKLIQNHGKTLILSNS